MNEDNPGFTADTFCGMLLMTEGTIVRMRMMACRSELTQHQLAIFAADFNEREMVYTL